MTGWFQERVGDRIQINSMLIVLCFVSVLALSSQSAASYPTYVLGLAMLFSVPRWNDAFRVPLFWQIALLLFYLCASAFWSEPFSWRQVGGIFGRGALVLMFVVAMAECELRGQVQVWLGRALAIVGIGAATAALLTYWMDPPADGRLSGLGQLDNPVVIGLIFGATLILLAESVLSDTQTGWRATALIGAVIVVLAVYLSGSRNAWLSTGVGLTVLVFAKRIRDPQRFIAAFVTSIVMFSVLLVVVLSSEATRDILLPRGDSFRLDIWQETLEHVESSSRQAIGLGIATPDQVQFDGNTFSHPHNMYLAVYFQGGLIALVLFISLVIGVIWSLFVSYGQRSAKLALGLISMALASYLLDGHEIIDKVGETWFLFWLPVAIALGLAWNQKLPTQAGRDPEYPTR